MNMKKTLGKMLICFLIFLVLFNFTLVSDAYTPPIQGNMGGNSTRDETIEEESSNSDDDETSSAENIFNTMYNLITNILGAFVGLGTWIFRIGIVALCFSAQVIISGVVSLGGATTDGIFVTPFTIFFNKVPLLDIDFMDLSVSDANIKAFRTQVATWYYILRMIATAILLLILIYIGIRMAISTIASDKAMYQKMLTDWACSLALLYLLHYFIIFILKLNNIFVGILSDIGDSGGNALNFSNFALKIGLQSISPVSGFEGIASTIIYALIVWQTLKFLLLYLKRMVTIGFLIIISPLITITYSIDKIGDQKAQALNTWMKEFCYNILIQPFHCIIYLAFVDIAISLIEPNAIENLISGTNTLAASILAIVCIKFVDEGEKIVRKIFGFEKASSLGTAVAAATAVSAFVSKAGDFGKSLSKASSVSKNMFKTSRIGNVINKGTQKVTDKFSNVKGRAKEMAAADIANGGAWNNLSNEQKQNYMQNIRDNDKAKKEAAKAARKEKFNNSKPIGTMRAMKERATKSREAAKESKAIQMAKAEGKDWNSMSDSDKQIFRNRAQNAIDSRPLSAFKNTAKKTISSARTTVSNKLHDSDYMSTIIGITAGLAMYSSNGALESIAVGMGTKSAVKGFLSNTSQQLGNDITETMQATENITNKEFKSKEDVTKHLEGVKFAGDSGAYSDNNISDQINNLLNTLKTFMSQQQAQVTIRNMQQQALNNPNFNADDYLNKLFDELNKEETNPEIKAKLQDTSSRNSAIDSAKEYLEFAAEARTYSGIKTAEDGGISVEEIADIVSKNMNVSEKGSSSKSVTVTNKVTNEEETITSTVEVGKNLDDAVNDFNAAANQAGNDFKAAANQASNDFNAAADQAVENAGESKT
jgi:hypothetical protein